MSSPEIIYLITRTHGLRRHLLKSEDLIRGLKAKNVAELSDLLLKSDYSPELSKIPAKEMDAYQLERVFYQKLSERLSFLIKITSGKTRKALEDYYKKIEAENLKRIIRAVHGKEKITEDQLIPVPRRFQSVNLSALCQAQTVTEVINLLRETPYKHLIEKIELYAKYNNPIILEAETDRIYYDLLWDSLARIVDRDKVKELIGTEIDLKNLSYVLLTRRMKTQELLEEILLKHYYKLPKNILSRLIATPFETIGELQIGPPYGEIVERVVELIEKEMFTQADQVFLRNLYLKAEKLALRNPNNLVFVFVYLQFCFREAQNLTTLAIGKQLMLDEERIRGSLFL